MALNPRKALIESSFDQRGRSRRKLRLEVNTQASGLPSSAAIVHDISETGILIEISTVLVPGDVIDVELSQTNVKLAEIVWVSGNLAGCKFVENLNSGSISAALLQGSFAPPAPIVQSGDNNTTLSSESDLTTAPQSRQLSFLAKLWVIFSLTSLLWAAAIALAVWLIF